MKTLYTLLDPCMPSQLTVHKDYGVLANRLGYEHKFFAVNEFHDGNIDVDSDPNALFIFEGALLKVSERTTKDIKQWFPNAKIVCLGSQSKSYKYGYDHFTNNPTREFEFYDGYDVDLWLDINDELVEDYRNKGITTDYWMWTTSHHLIDEFESRPKLPKTHDIICLMAHCMEYRINLKRFLEQRYKCIWGRGAGDGNYDYDHLHQIFSGARFVLITSSPSWFPNRSVTGFRDWLGPINGTVAISDDYPDAVKKYPCPIFKYDDIGAIPILMEELWNDQERYQQILQEQVIWTKENTIAIQLYNKMKEYKII